jgi:hypothetical protein
MAIPIHREIAQPPQRRPPQRTHEKRPAGPVQNRTSPPLIRRYPPIRSCVNARFNQGYDRGSSQSGVRRHSRQTPDSYGPSDRTHRRIPGCSRAVDRSTQGERLAGSADYLAPLFDRRPTPRLTSFRGAVVGGPMILPESLFQAFELASPRRAVPSSRAKR